MVYICNNIAFYIFIAHNSLLLRPKRINKFLENLFDKSCQEILYPTILKYWF